MMKNACDDKDDNAHAETMKHSKSGQKKGGSSGRERGHKCWWCVAVSAALAEAGVGIDGGTTSMYFYS